MKKNSSGNRRKQQWKTHKNEDIKAFAQSLNDLGELIGERKRVLSRILEELELY